MKTAWTALKIVFIWAIFMLAIYEDVSLELGVTENTRNAYYEGASGRTPP